MALPGVNIEINTDGRQSLPRLADGTFGMLCTATNVTGSGNFSLNKSYLLPDLEDLKNLGVTPENNAFLYGQVSDYFANTSNRLWLRCVTATVTMPQLVDASLTHGRRLIDDSNEAIRVLLVCKQTGSGPVTRSGGLDPQVHTAVPKAQQLAGGYKNIHLGVVLDGQSFSGTAADLTEYQSSSYENVAISIAANDNTGNASVGFLGGLLSTLSVETRLSRKRNGAVPVSTGYLTSKSKLEDMLTSLGVIHDRHYITYRHFPGEAGVYFANDFTLSGSFVNRLSRVRVIDKIKRIAYRTGIREVDEKVPLNADGTIREDVARRIEADIEQALAVQMLGNTEISSVEAQVRGSNILQTEQLGVELRITPVGYSNSINYLIYL